VWPKPISKPVASFFFSGNFPCVWSLMRRPDSHCTCFPQFEPSLTSCEFKVPPDRPVSLESVRTDWPVMPGNGEGVQRDLPVASVSNSGTQRGREEVVLSCRVSREGCRSFCRSGDNVAALTRASCTSLER
jgi:hypothetical protein